MLSAPELFLRTSSFSMSGVGAFVEKIKVAIGLTQTLRATPKMSLLTSKITFTNILTLAFSRHGATLYP